MHKQVVKGLGVEEKRTPKECNVKKGNEKEGKSAEKEVNEGGMEDSPLLFPFHHTCISSYVPLANSHNIPQMESLLAV